jgi:Cu(I)/Ag(I) efflux system membrane fusion protein
MNHDATKTSLVVGVAATSLVVGVIAGFFAAHRMMGEMPGMTMEKRGDSGSSERADAMRDMKQMEMKGMPMEGTMPMKDMEPMAGMSATPSGIVAIPAVARQLIGVRSAPAAYASLEEEIRTVGTVTYDERGFTQVTLKISGWVKDVFVDSIGRPVRKGEPLFTIYSPDLLTTQDEYLLAVKTQAQLAASPLADAKANAAALVVSARERLRLWDVTDAQIAAMERRSKAEPVLTVYAPSSGIVMKREALPGKYVEPGTTLYEIADLSTVWISADIYESEVAATKLGQPASVTFAAYPGETFHGKVAYLYPTLNTEARTVRVRLELPNPGLKLKPGMYGNVTLQTDAVKTLVVPKEAVLETGLRQLVFMDRGQGRYEPASVKLGRRSQDYVEVIEGLKAGDRVATSANFLLDAESKLTSASSMQAMMGRIGMADWQMRGAHEAKMEGMEGMDMGSMKGMEGMKGMKGMEGASITETRQVAGLSLTLTTVPEQPKAGDVLLRLKVTDQAGKAITNAQVNFIYTMPMPGMTDSRAAASHTKDGFYEGKVLFGMGGTWVVTVNVTVPGRPPITEKFRFSVAGGGM